MKETFYKEEQLFEVKKVKRKNGDEWALKINGSDAKLDPNWAAAIMYSVYLKCVGKLDDCDQLEFEANVKDNLRKLFKNGM